MIRKTTTELAGVKTRLPYDTDILGNCRWNAFQAFHWWKTDTVLLMSLSKSIASIPEFARLKQDQRTFFLEKRRDPDEIDCAFGCA